MDMDQVATVKPGLGRVGLQDLDWIVIFKATDLTASRATHFNSVSPLDQQVLKNSTSLSVVKRVPNTMWCVDKSQEILISRVSAAPDGKYPFVSPLA